MRILFICKDHGVRSRLAEALARHQLGDEHEFASAGLAPGRLHPLTVEALLAVDAPTDRSSELRLSEVNASKFDLAVVIGTERDVASALPRGLKHLTWPLMEPLDPPAPTAELKSRFRELRLALEHHMSSLKKMRRSA